MVDICIFYVQSANICYSNSNIPPYLYQTEAINEYQTPHQVNK